MHYSRSTSLLLLVLLWSCKNTTGEHPEESFSIQEARQIEKAAWETLPDILAQITPPIFPKTTFDVLDFGAKPDSTFDSQPAIQQAIDQCNAAGGGRVVLPAGNYFSAGPLRLKSNVDLHLAEGSRLTFGNHPSKYTPLVKVRWEGTVCWNWSPLIYAFQQQNIAITGKGTIDGNGEEWSVGWRKEQKPDQTALRQMGNDLVPEDQRVFGNGFLDLNGDGRDDSYGDGDFHYLRPTLIELYECENILIEDLTLLKSPFWTVHPTFCKNVTIRGLNIYGGNLNDDGVDPDGCENVLIENCYIETHDDAIAIKAGRDQDAWQRPGSKNLVIRNCRLNSDVNSFAIGSEMSGGVENVFVEDCHILHGRHGLNFKCNLDRGGRVQRIFMRNIQIDSLEEAMFIFRMDYHGYRGNHYPTQFTDFYAGNIQCNQVDKLGFKIVGVEAQPITRLYLHDINILRAGEAGQVEKAMDILVDEVRINGEAWRP